MIYRQSLLVQFILSLFFISLITNAQTLTPEQIFTKVDKSVVVVLSLDSNGDIISQGSGVVFDKKGLIATNFHIIGDGTHLVIKHYDEIIEDVEIVGFDAKKDILILKIRENLLPSIKVADVSSLQPGQRIYAVGSPLGLENTISEGIISGLRFVDELGRDYIQISASISSGSSGGAVVNRNGELIGISTATLNGGQNLNFAIKISDFIGLKTGTKSKSEIDDGNLYSRGSKALENGEFANAIRLYTEYIIKNPNEATAYFNRGYAKVELEDYRGGIQDYTKVIEINPNFTQAYVNRGLAKVELKDFRGAIKDYTKAIEINPNYANAYFNKGSAKFKLKDYHGAIQDYGKAIEINPEYAAAYINRGNARNELQDFRGAIQDYNKAIDINPNFAEAYYNRGLAKVELSDYRGAIQDFTKAIEIDPSDAVAYTNRGIANAMLQYFKNAIIDFTKAIEIDPYYASAYITRGHAKNELNDKNGACLDWSKAGELGDMRAYDLIKEYCR